MIALGYYRLGDEAVCFWHSEHGDPKIDLHWRTGEPHLLCWRSDYSRRRPETKDEMEDLADEIDLRPVTHEAWISFQRDGKWPQ